MSKVHLLGSDPRTEGLNKAGSLAGSLARWLAGSLARWLARWLPGSLANWLADRQAVVVQFECSGGGWASALGGPQAGRTGVLVNWLAGRQAPWLASK